MTIPNFVFVLALIFAAFQQWEAKGRDLVAWAVILICVGLLWGSIIK
jgi:hypothetical protein